ncbi:MAG: hypothetical protein F6K31_05690 [Symploca sp. SIO2G7]|nr:hypothetical protein [Symploca sp. SIO2G7]
MAHPSFNVDKNLLLLYQQTESIKVLAQRLAREQSPYAQEALGQELDKSLTELILMVGDLKSSKTRSRS